MKKLSTFVLAALLIASMLLFVTPDAYAQPIPESSALKTDINVKYNVSTGVFLTDEKQQEFIKDLTNEGYDIVIPGQLEASDDGIVYQQEYNLKDFGKPLFVLTPEKPPLYSVVAGIVNREEVRSDETEIVWEKNENDQEKTKNKFQAIVDNDNKQIYKIFAPSKPGNTEIPNIFVSGRTQQIQIDFTNVKDSITKGVIIPDCIYIEKKGLKNQCKEISSLPIKPVPVESVWVAVGKKVIK